MPISTQTAPVADDHPVEIRFLEPEETPELTACIRRSYGDSYDAQWVYEPEVIAARIREGDYRSVVGLADGEIVGHVGLTLDARDTEVGEAGQAVVDLRFRGHHLFGSLKRYLAAWCADDGMFGIFSEATAAHPYSQKANLDLNATETGVLLNYIPATVDYEGISRTEQTKRISAVLFYLMTNPGHIRPVYAPKRHHKMVARILDQSGLRGLIKAPNGEKPPEGNTRMHVLANEAHGTAIITIEAYGEDLLEAVGARLSEYRRNGFACIYLDLPLADPETAQIEDDLERLGFFFGGVFPNLRVDGDVLRLQALRNPEAIPHAIRTASPFGKELLDYVLKERIRLR